MSAKSMPLSLPPMYSKLPWCQSFPRERDGGPIWKFLWMKSRPFITHRVCLACSLSPQDNHFIVIICFSGNMLQHYDEWNYFCFRIPKDLSFTLEVTQSKKAYITFRRKDEKSSHFLQFKQSHLKTVSVMSNFLPSLVGWHFLVQRLPWTYFAEIET